mmetsp:Transcript_60651/g.72906  ORF Transcript_60651/g.72906 Transcript_60651/m.72906 type:complete len:219 (-) Transcript_60651:1058-1714(-)
MLVVRPFPCFHRSFLRMPSQTIQALLCLLTFHVFVSLVLVALSIPCPVLAVLSPFVPFLSVPAPPSSGASSARAPIVPSPSAPASAAPSFPSLLSPRIPFLFAPHASFLLLFSSYPTSAAALDPYDSFEFVPINREVAASLLTILPLVPFLVLTIALFFQLFFHPRYFVSFAAVEKRALIALPVSAINLARSFQTFQLSDGAAQSFFVLHWFYHLCSL